MSSSPKSHCHACNDTSIRLSGAYIPRGTGKTRGFPGHKGNKFECMNCNTVHVFDNNGQFLGFAK